MTGFQQNTGSLFQPLSFREYPTKPVELELGKEGVSLPSSFKLKAPVKILVHGFLSSHRHPFSETLKNGMNSN
jgi:hypothetical protein